MSSVRSGSSLSVSGASGNFTPSETETGLHPYGESSLTPKHDGSGPSGSDNHSQYDSSRSPRGAASSSYGGGGSTTMPPPGFGSVSSRSTSIYGSKQGGASSGRIPRPPRTASSARGGSEAGGSTGGRSHSARNPRVSTGGRVRKPAPASATQRAQQLLLLPSLSPGNTANNNGSGTQTAAAAATSSGGGGIVGEHINQQQQSLVAQLDSERRRHEAEGRFLDAQECLDVMRALTADQGRQVIADTIKRNIASDAKQALLDEHRRQIFKFTRLWEEALQEFEGKGDKHIADITERQRREFEEFEELVRSDLATRVNPHYSKGVLSGRRELAQLVELKRYKEAAAVQKQLDAAETEERQHFEETLSLRFASQTKQLKKRYMLELRTTRQKIGQERDNLVTQRRSNYETLLQRHLNAVAAFDQRARTGAARDSKAMSRQLDAMVNCPSKTTLANLALNTG